MILYCHQNENRSIVQASERPGKTQVINNGNNAVRLAGYQINVELFKPHKTYFNIWAIEAVIDQYVK